MKKGLIGILMLCLVCLSSFSVFAATGYTDIEAHWAKNAIERWSDEKVVNGYADNTFKPDNNVTRAEFVTMIVRLFEPAKVADLSKYKDVEKNDWFYDALAKAVEMEVVKGYDNNTLKPEANITRQEAMVILNRILNLTASKDASGDKFSDANKIASWAEDTLAAFAQNGYVNGYEDGTVRPTGFITRAEAAKILDKAIGMIINKAGKYDLSEVEGTVIIKAKDVEITKVNENLENVIVVNEEMKDALKLDKEYTEEVVVINEAEPVKEEEKKPSTGGSSGGGSSSSTSSVAKIVITSTTTPSGDAYTVKKSGIKVADGKKLTVVVDGKTILNAYKCSESDFAANMQKVINALDAEKAVNTLTAKYNENAGIREWGMNTVLAIGVDSPDAQLAAITAAVLGNNDKVDVKVVYDALTAAGVSADTIKTKAVEVLPDTFTYAEGIAALNQI